MRKSLVSLVVGSLLAGSTVSAVADNDGPHKRQHDFGEKVERVLRAKSGKYFGVEKPIKKSASGTVARAQGQDAYDLIKLAKGLKATILTREAGNKADMFAFYPNNAAPTHLVFCIEGGVETIGTLPGGMDKLNPSVQLIDMASGEVETVLRGMSRCDGIRATAWGTVLATEEAGDGQAYELIDLLNTRNHTVVDRASGTIVDENADLSTTIVKRDALPTMSWEGLTVTAEGVVIAGDELRPGTDVVDKDGGTLFKFIPSVAHIGGNIADLVDSPLSDGSVYAMRVDCREDSSGSFPQYGQGCEVGNAAWIPVTAANARDDADVAGATGYYRPEDLHRDPTFEGEGIRFCWTNTGREAASNYGEVMCGIDESPLFADVNDATVVVNRFVEGDADFNSLDNLAIQPGTGNVYIIEDHPNGDVFACLPDGDDRDIKTDGCVKILSVKDQSAEPTGFGFSADGRTAILSIQHSDDDNMPLVDDYPTDDIVVITGFRK